MSGVEASAAGAFVVIAGFGIKPDSMEASRGAASDDACHSLAAEPGCRQFDATVIEGERDAVVFHEVYDDHAAFDRHLETPHLKHFQTAFPSLVVEDRPVRFAERHHPHG